MHIQKTTDRAAKPPDKQAKRTGLASGVASTP